MVDFIGQAGITFFESTDSSFWIGLNALIVPGNWSWTDNTTLDYTKWALSEPKNISTSCGAVTIQNSFWISDDCFKVKPFVCEVPSMTLSTISPATTTYPSHPAYINCTPGWLYFEQT